MKSSLIAAILVLCIALSCRAESIDWYSVNSGGGTASSEAYTVQATIGQPVAGLVTTPPYTADPKIHYIGFWSGDLQVPSLPNTIRDAKLLASGTWLSLSGLAVTTASPADFTDRIYLEAGDRSSGIQFYHGSSPLPALPEGTRVSVTGTLKTLPSGEIAIVGTQVIPLQASSALRPLGLRTGQVGGRTLGQPGTAGAIDLNNTGLLIRVWGLITGVEAGTNYLLINDGSGVSSPLRVDASELDTVPESGFVQVTGISSVELRGADLVPVLRLRRQADVVPIGAF